MKPRLDYSADEEGIVGIKDSSGESDRFDRYVKDFPEEF